MTLAIVGLGNPSREYAGSRHNAGLSLLLHFSDRSGIPLDRKQGEVSWGEGSFKDRRIYLVFPSTFMNLSGRVVPWLRRKGVGSPDSWLLLQDDLDTPFGVVRFREKGRSGGQRGVESILQVSGTSEIARIKFGIGRPEFIGSDVSQFVLSSFSPEERERVPALLENGYSLIERWVIAHPADIAV